MRQFGDGLEQLHGPSGFPAPFSERQFGGVAPAERPNVCGYINKEREVNRMVAPCPLRRAPDVFKRLAVHVCEILRSSRDFAPGGSACIGSHGLRRPRHSSAAKNVGEDRGPFLHSTTRPAR